jgi:hypothetical protein
MTIVPIGQRNATLVRHATFCAAIIARDRADRETVEFELQAFGESIGLEPEEVRETVRHTIDGCLARMR